MHESKSELTDRLRREGRWTEASRYRDKVRNELKVQGVKRSEASERAWEAMADEYPPLEGSAGCAAGTSFGIPKVPDGPEAQEELRWLIEATSEDDIDLGRDIRWVYEHLWDEGVTPAAAPGGGAWALLKWARANPNDFFRQVLPKGLSDDQPRRRTRSGLHPETELQMEELKQMLNEMSRGWEKELVKDAPEMVRQEVCSNIESWRRGHDVELEAEAREILELRMIHLVDKCMLAAANNPEAFRREGPCR